METAEADPDGSHDRKSLPAGARRTTAHRRQEHHARTASRAIAMPPRNEQPLIRARPVAATGVGHMQPRIMAAVRTRGTTIAGLGREALAGRAIRHQRVSPPGRPARSRGRRRRRPAISREQGRASLRSSSLRGLLRGHMREDADVIRRPKLPRFSPCGSVVQASAVRAAAREQVLGGWTINRSPAVWSDSASSDLAPSPPIGARLPFGVDRDGPGAARASPALWCPRTPYFVTMRGAGRDRRRSRPCLGPANTIAAARRGAVVENPQR